MAVLGIVALLAVAGAGTAWAFWMDPAVGTERVTGGTVPSIPKFVRTDPDGNTSLSNNKDMAISWTAPTPPGNLVILGYEVELAVATDSNDGTSGYTRLRSTDWPNSSNQGTQGSLGALPLNSSTYPVDASLSQVGTQSNGGPSCDCAPGDNTATSGQCNNKILTCAPPNAVTVYIIPPGQTSVSWGLKISSLYRMVQGSIKVHALYGVAGNTSIPDAWVSASIYEADWQFYFDGWGTGNPAWCTSLPTQSLSDSNAGKTDCPGKTQDGTQFS